METKIKNKLNRIKSDAIEKYLNFWGFSSLIFDIDTPEYGVLKREYEKINRGESEGKALVVTQQYVESNNEVEYISFLQLIYDLDVFCTIPEELNPILTSKRFSLFIDSSIAKMKSSGWDVLFSNKCKTYELLNLCDCELLDKKHILKSDKILLINCGDEIRVDEFYEFHKKEFRIERHRALELFREWIVFEIYNYFKEQLSPKGVKVFLANWEWAQNNYLYPQKNISSFDKEQRSVFSVYSIAGNESKYESFLKLFYGDDYSLEYVKNVMDIPLRNYYGIGCIQHNDMASKYLNVSLGERKTKNCPPKYNNTIYMLGGCVFFGYAIDDSKTLASYLQRKINSECDCTYKVANYAVWGGNIDETYNTFYELEYKKGDIIIISYAGLIPFGDFDISKGFINSELNSDCYYDGIVHCNAAGYELLADQLYKELINEFDSAKSVKNCSFRLLKDKVSIKRDSEYEKAVLTYINSIKTDLPPLFETDKTYGCIVMNCNPFTLGHKYLIETASKEVDYLIIFVVEENKSFFPFSDRISLVKQGTDGFENVYVVPSGKLIISAVTFPGYFLKDNPDTSVIDSSSDVQIFGRYIASSLGITRRFVGDEPADIVTNNYNKTMQKLLPQYGVEVSVIKRKAVRDSVISASTVRKLLKEKKFDEIKEYVPETTYNYLVNSFSGD